MSVGIKIFSPATISNFNCTKDQVAVALENLGVEVIVSRGTIPGMNVTISGKHLDSSDKEYIQKLAINLSTNFWAENGFQNHSLDIKVQANFGSKSGLGLHEAISVGVIWALIEYHNLNTTKEEVLKFIINQKIEDLLPSNLCATIFGGFQLTTLENNNLQHYRIPCPSGLYFTIISSSHNMNTVEKNLNHEINSIILSKTAAFILGMNSTNLDLIKFSLENQNYLQQIKSAFPYLKNLDSINVSRETLGIGMTENKSTLFFLSANSLNAENIATSVEDELKKEKIKSIKIICPVDHEGVYMC